MPTFKEAVDYLIREGYLRQVKKRFVVTAKFNEAMLGVSSGIIELASGQVAVREPQLGPATDWEQRYMQFIMDAQVPRRGQDSQGNLYEMNKYSKEGVKAFKEAFTKHGFNYDMLVKSTMLYYKSSIKYKQSIGNYMSQGAYISDYHDFIGALQDNSLEEHIDEKTDDGNTSYSLG